MKIFARSITWEDQERSLLLDTHKSKKINLPLSDFEIIELQNLFMTPSLHTLQTKDIATGRNLVDTLLRSLNHHHYVGCLTNLTIDLDKDICDLFTLIKKQQESYGLAMAIEQVFIEMSCMDFVWIEFTKELRSIIPEKHLKKACELLGMNDKRPVIVITYDSVF